MAILAMTGGGKTVATRRIIKGLSDYGYPMLIFDPMVIIWVFIQ